MRYFFLNISMMQRKRFPTICTQTNVGLQNLHNRRWISSRVTLASPILSLNPHIFISNVSDKTVKIAVAGLASIHLTRISGKFWPWNIFFFFFASSGYIPCLEQFLNEVWLIRWRMGRTWNLRFLEAYKNILDNSYFFFFNWKVEKFLI